MILLNLLYTGKFISETHNIGHEMINLVRTDSGDNYIYITPYGTVSNADKIEAIIMARSIGDGCVEVVGKAECLEKCDPSPDISYCGIKLNKIMNEGNGEVDTVYATFKSKKVRLPKKTIRLSVGKEVKETIFLPEGDRLCNMSMKNYYSPENKPKSYSILKDLLQNNEYWETENTTSSITILDLDKDKIPSFLEIIKKTDDEIIISNLLVHYFRKYPEEFCQMAATIFKINLDKGYMVHREKEHIDIMIKDDENIIIIENKIKSGINGNQLEKYYNYAVKQNELDKKDKRISCFLLIPNYYNIDLSKHAGGDKFSIVRYGDIYEFYASKGAAIYDRHYADFLDALYQHTLPYRNDLEIESKKRFAKAIRKIR